VQVGDGLPLFFADCLFCCCVPRCAPHFLQQQLLPCVQDVAAGISCIPPTRLSLHPAIRPSHTCSWLRIPYLETGWQDAVNKAFAEDPGRVGR